MKKKYSGSCHCQAVKFEIEADFASGIRRCNCTFCYKTRFQKIFVQANEFKLLTSDHSLSDYRAINSKWPEGHIHHYFCKTCGVRTFSRGFLKLEPFNGWFYAVNAVTLDDVSPEEIISAPVIYENGLHDLQSDEPREVRHL